MNHVLDIALVVLIGLGALALLGRKVFWGVRGKPDCCSTGPSPKKFGEEDALCAAGNAPRPDACGACPLVCAKRK